MWREEFGLNTNERWVFELFDCSNGSICYFYAKRYIFIVVRAQNSTLPVCAIIEVSPLQPVSKVTNPKLYCQYKLTVFG